MPTYKILNTNALKIIAILAMIVDHIGWAFIPTDSPMGALSHTIGRLTAPIMFFLLVEGYHHTKNAKRYGSRLLLFALISHLPYNWYYNNVFNGMNEVTFIPTSVIFVQLIGLIGLYLYHAVKLWQYKFLIVVAVVLVSGIADWAYFGAMIVFAFGIFYGSPWKQAVAYFAVNILMILNAIFLVPDTTIHTVIPLIVGPLLVFVILNMYNFQRGLKNVWTKWGFYIIYPLHLFIICGVFLYLTQ